MVLSVLSFNTIMGAVIIPATSKPTTPTVSTEMIKPSTTNVKPDISKMSVKEFEKLSGKKLNFFQKMAFKAAKKSMNKNDGKISKGLYVVLSILGFGWLAMGILDDWSGSDWIISLVLYFLFYLPGLIYSLVKMKKYYN